jgi:hypothetical protein
MSSIRAGATGTLLPNGLVLVTGGIDANGATSSVERFSPDGAHFIDAPSMQMPRANHTATLLADGRVLVAGGTGAGGAADATAEIYDSSSNVWLPAGSLNVARRGHTATRLPDGKVLIAGGDDNGVAIDSLEVFDPATALFTVVDGASTGARTLHAAAALLDGRVLIAGGFDGTNPLASTSIYDPETNTVSAGPDLSTPRSGLTATTLLDGRVLIAGGAGTSGELASAEIFDPATNAVTPTDNALSSPRQNHLAFLLPHNNQVLIVGGLAGGNPVAAAEYFTPWEGTNGVFCVQAICASGYQGPAAPATARAWAAGSALSLAADATTRTGPNDGLLVLAGGSGQKSAELFGFATVRTDREDYAPGTTVHITGSGWQPHESVALVLREAPFLDEHPLLDVEADDNGNIQSDEFVPDEHDIGVRFYLTAYGQESQAQTTFIDGTQRIRVVGGPASAPINWVRYSNTTCTPGAGNVNVIDSGSINAVSSGNGTNLPVDVSAAQSVGLTAGPVTGFTFSSWSGSGNFTTGAFTPTSNPGCLVGSGNTQNNDVNYSTAGSDLTATKTNNVSGATTLGNNWNWTVTVANSGSNAATFTAGQAILTDNLPNANISYGSATVVSPTGISGTGTINCAINGTQDLTCTATGGTVIIAAGTGSFGVQFTATPSAIGTFGNPRALGSCAVDPGGAIAESNEGNNGCSNSVTVTAPDLTATKTNNVGGATTLGAPWNWTVTAANSGNAAATFSAGQTILSDNLPNTNISYGSVSTVGASGISGTGTISCSIVSSNLSCVASGGTVIIGASGGTFGAQFSATPSAVGTFANPRGGGACAVDPGTFIPESNESNNACSDTVTVTAPDLTATKTNNVSGSTTLGNSWDWTVTVGNTGNAAATFTAGETILHDDLPSTNISYGLASVVGASGISGTGSISCSVVSSTLNCLANGGTVIIAATSGTFGAKFSATPAAIGTFANPRVGGSCAVDTGHFITESNEANNACSDSVTVTAADLTATKANDVSGITSVGTGWNWTVTAANTGNAPATFAVGQTILSDNLPDTNITYGSVSVVNSVGITGTILCGIASNNLTCAPSGGPVTIASTTGTFGARFSATASASGVFANPRSGGTCAIDPNANVSESDETNNSCSDSVKVLAAPTIAKAFGDATIPLNGSTSLTFTLTNPNAGDGLTGVSFTDNLPAGLVISSPNGLTNPCSLATLTATAGSSSISLSGATLSPGASCTIAVNVDGTSAGAKHNTTSTITSTNGGTGLTASADLTVLAPPTISKAFGAATIPLNGTTTLSFTLTNPNAGNSLTGVGFTDALPSGLVLGTPANVVNACGLAILSAADGANSISLSGATLVTGPACVITVDVKGTTAGAKNNTTSNISSTNGGTGGMASASLTVLAPPTISKSFGATTIPLNGTTTLSFTVANPNALGLTGVSFTDTLPTGLVVGTPRNLVNACGLATLTAADGAGSVDLSGANLAGSASCVITVDVKGTTAGVKSNTTSTITSTNGGTGLTASADLTVLVPPTISKSFGATTIPLNGSTSLSFTITNPNAATALTGVTFSDTLPAGLVVSTPNGLSALTGCGPGVASATAGGGSISLSTGATVAGGGTCTFSVNVTGTTAGAKNNTTGNITSTNGGTGTTSNTASVTVLAPPTITKVFGSASIVYGSSTSLTFTIANPNSTDSLTGVGFSDTLPAGLVVSTPNGLTNSCSLSTITAVAGSGSVSLSGAILLGNASCTIAVNVTATSAGSKSNVTGNISSTNGGTGTTANASLNVTKAPLTITASSHTITFNDPVPTITPSYSGFVLSDTPADLDTPPTCSTTYTQGSLIGTYPSNCSGAMDANYNITFVPGTVKVLTACSAFNGFLPPVGGAVENGTGGSFLDPVRSFKLNSTVPVKFSATCFGVPLVTGIHTLSATKYSSSTTSDPAIDATPTDAATTGDQFRLTDSEWHFNLSTKALGGNAQGIWLFTATLFDGSTYTVWVEIKK